MSAAGGSPYLTCPLCGFEFDRADALCHHGCPFNAVCHLARCPSCDYEFPQRPAAGSWLRRLFRRPGRTAASADGLATLSDLPAGQRARVVSAARENASRSDALAVFGLVPGAEVTLVQQSPSCVVRVGETDLALDPEIAREILVRLPAAA